ncbi:hypothetical protein GOC74_02120 [Halomicrobium mukohataei]|uniref:Uncharacterized protein n=1 Tax=Halomicrobium mukohataei TaxID=57705 RepID=A0A847UBU1_9EURY|nr:hypothetical protein [Halomicrobium mukohataei]NLV08734.1 hypothetical protein [Halomicrobium mukohataei]
MASTNNEGDSGSGGGSGSSFEIMDVLTSRVGMALVGGFVAALVAGYLII